MRRVTFAAVLAVTLCCASAAHAGKPMRAYNQLWAKADKFYGADGQPPPWVVFMRHPIPGAGVAFVVPRADGGREIRADPQVANLLLLRSRGPNRNLHEAGQMQLLHEWAHIYQRSDLITADEDSTPHNLREKEARAAEFGEVAGRCLFRGICRALDLEQFGSNYGANPRLITWRD